MIEMVNGKVLIEPIKVGTAEVRQVAKGLGSFAQKENVFVSTTVLVGSDKYPAGKKVYVATSIIEQPWYKALNEIEGFKGILCPHEFIAAVEK